MLKAQGTIWMISQEDHKNQRWWMIPRTQCLPNIKGKTALWSAELYNLTHPRQMESHPVRPNKTLVPPITKKLCTIDTHSERKVSFLQGSDKGVYKPYSRKVTITRISWTTTNRLYTSVCDCGWEDLGLVLYALLLLCLDWLLLLLVEREKGRGNMSRLSWEVEIFCVEWIWEVRGKM